MTAADFVSAEPCCYGFVNDVETRCNETWKAQARSSFRGCWLWLWGDATLHGLSIGAQQQLCAPIHFREMQRDVRPEDFLRLTRGGVANPLPTRRALLGELIHPTLAADLGAPHLQLITARTGDYIRFRMDGAVRGVVLVGVKPSR